eukprot:CAMPEP_0180537322 /NCGR_PEP_ID=MMETSP1036_2-20121128/65752_1 /TAXON_ID=632150 /ORGANISM="Azadinium spinosum, Strain 3D9" /LENGTH=33 /DNA_ID= /DNA_START= /DNA_END= /DNA_ORIENTATION=
MPGIPKDTSAAHHSAPLAIAMRLAILANDRLAQ